MAKRVKRAAPKTGVKRDEMIVSDVQLAKVFGVSCSLIYLWAKEKGMPRAAKGKYDLAAVWQWREKLLKGERGGGVKDSARLLKAQADEREEKALLLELKRKAEEGKLMPIEDVEAGRIERIIAVKTALRNLAPVLGRRLVGASGVDEMERITDEEVNQCLAKFANAPE